MRGWIGSYRILIKRIKKPLPEDNGGHNKNFKRIYLSNPPAGLFFILTKTPCLL